MSHEFLPDGFDTMKLDKPYWRLAQMKEGDNRLRIVTKPIAGWLDWQNNKPLRFRPEDKPKSSVDPLKPFKAFWACYVWDYARENLYILEITQGSVIKALAAFGSDQDWGDFTKYDLKIKKEGTGKETKYHVTPMPHKPIAEPVEKALKMAPVRLEALYEGKDPWTDLVASVAKETPKAPSPVEIKQSEQLFDEVKGLLDQHGEDGKKMLTSFFKAYAISSMLEASDDQLKQLKVRLVEMKSNKERKAG